MAVCSHKLNESGALAGKGRYTEDSKGEAATSMAIGCKKLGAIWFMDCVLRCCGKFVRNGVLDVKYRALLAYQK